MNPKATTPLIRQGSLYLSTAMDSLAKVSFEKAATIDPDDGRIHAGLGRVHIRNGNPDSAAVYLQVALEQTPTDPDLVCDYSNILLQETREVEAIRLLENVLESNPYHPRIRYMLSRCYAAVDRKLEAARQTKTFERLRRTNQQIQSLENAVAEQPTANNYSALSHLYSRTGRDSLARASYRRATTLDPLVTAPQESHGFGSF
jgi:Tfp pilus assembly protein PilF